MFAPTYEFVLWHDLVGERRNFCSQAHRNTTSRSSRFRLIIYRTNPETRQRAVARRISELSDTPNKIVLLKVTCQ